LRIFAQVNELKVTENFLLMQIFNRIATAAAVESQNIFPRMRTDFNRIAAGHGNRRTTAANIRN